MPSVSLIFEVLLALHVLAVLWVVADSVRRGCAPIFVLSLFAKALLLPVVTVKSYLRNRHRPLGPDRKPMSTAAISIVRARELHEITKTQASGTAAKLGLPPGLNVSDLRSIEAARTAGFIDEAQYEQAKTRLLEATAEDQDETTATVPEPTRHSRPYVPPVPLPANAER